MASVYAPHAVEDPDYGLRLALHREHGAHVPDYGVARHDHLREMFDAGLDAERLDPLHYQALILGCLYPDSLNRPTLGQVAEAMNISVAGVFEYANIAIVHIRSYYSGLSPEQDLYIKQRLDTQALLAGVMAETRYYKRYPSVKSKVVCLPKPKPKPTSKSKLKPKLKLEARSKPRSEPVSMAAFKVDSKLRRKFELSRIIASEQRFLADNDLAEEVFTFARRTNTPMQIKVISAIHLRRKESQIGYESLAKHFESYAEDIQKLEARGLQALWGAVSAQGSEAVQNTVKGWMSKTIEPDAKVGQNPDPKLELETVAAEPVPEIVVTTSAARAADVRATSPQVTKPNKSSRLRREIDERKAKKQARKKGAQYLAVPISEIQPKPYNPIDDIIRDL